MKLKDRLSTLRRESGSETPSVPADLAGRLQRLRTTHPAPPAAGPGRLCDPAALARQLDGELLAPGVILTERRVPLASQHGRIALARLREAATHLPEGEGLDPERLVFLDTETTGLAGGTGTVVFMLGMARAQGEALTVRQYLLTGFGGESTMLRQATAWLAEADTLVTYNGKGFDVPLLAARCRLAGVADLFSGRAHLDLLYPIRRAYARRWDDCRLATVEQRLLRFQREDDLPGALAPEAWFAFVQRGDPRRLPGVAKHNFFDLLSLSALVPALNEVYRAPGGWQADVAALARMYAERGAPERALALLIGHRDMLCTEGRLDLASLYRRAGQWAEACAIWETLAEEGSPEALERLAKYHEHVRRDYRAALHYARRLPAGAHASHRAARLERKLGETPIPG